MYFTYVLSPQVPVFVHAYMQSSTYVHYLLKQEYVSADGHDVTSRRWSFHPLELLSLERPFHLKGCVT